MAPTLKPNCAIKPPCFFNMVVVLYNSVETKFYFEKYIIYFWVVVIIDLSSHYNEIKIYM
jgi:hypothetical protein